MTEQRLGLVILGHQEPVAQGLNREIYIHPDDPGLIIKVRRRDGVGERPMTWWRKTRLRYGVGWYALREIGEFIALHERSPAYARYVERVFGLVETDLGLGLVVEALRTQTGEIAPTIASLARKGPIDGKVRAKLDALIEGLLESDIIFSDLHTSNIVYAYDECTGDEKCVLIDGFGEKQLIPLAAWSSAVNARNKRRYFRDFEAEISRLSSGARRKLPKAERRWLHRMR